jgi:hypothetical protein
MPDHGETYGRKVNTTGLAAELGRQPPETVPNLRNVVAEIGATSVQLRTAPGDCGAAPVPLSVDPGDEPPPGKRDKT